MMDIQPADAWGIAAVALLSTEHWIGGSVALAIALILVAWNVWRTR